jgi:hypothetical protein
MAFTPVEVDLSSIEADYEVDPYNGKSQHVEGEFSLYDNEYFIYSNLANSRAREYGALTNYGSLIMDKRLVVKGKFLLSELEQELLHIVVVTLIIKQPNLLPSVLRRIVEDFLHEIGKRKTMLIKREQGIDKYDLVIDLEAKYNELVQAHEELLKQRAEADKLCEKYNEKIKELDEVIAEAKKAGRFNEFLNFVRSKRDEV